MRPVQDLPTAKPSLARVARSEGKAAVPTPAQRSQSRPNLPEARIGTSGWHYDSWWGPFFPEGLRKKDALDTTSRASRGGAQRAVLPHADARGRAGLVRADPRRFPVRLEGIEVHHPLEAALERCDSIARADGDPARAAGAQGRAVLFQLPPRCTRTGSGSPPSSRCSTRPGATSSSSATRAGTRRRSSTSCASTTRRSASRTMPPRRRPGKSRRAGLHPRPRADRALPRQLLGRDARAWARDIAAGGPGQGCVVLLRQRHEERGAA